MPPPQKEFLCERLKRIEYFSSNTSEYDLAKQGLRQYPDLFQLDDFTRQREADLLKKLLHEVEEGKVDRAIKSWRSMLMDKYKEHEAYYREMQEAYDEWARLPWYLKEDIPEPPHPPVLQIRDQGGHMWVVDLHLIAVLDDIASRLEKWMSVEDEQLRDGHYPT